MSAIDEIYLIEVVERGLAGTGFTAAEATAIRTDLDTMLARPVITTLGAVPDVDLTGLANGQGLIYDSATATWEPGSVGGTIKYVRKGDPVIGTDVNNLAVQSGLNATYREADAGANRIVDVSVAFAGTGAANTAARSDHSHNYMKRERADFAATGLLSSGFRTLASYSLTLVAGVPYVVEAELSGTVKGGGAGSSFYLERLTINGNTRTSTQMQAVGGVPRGLDHSHHIAVTGTGAAITITAAIGYDTGDAIDVRAGELHVRAWPIR